jgi:murein L,D-transpeptidase YcbB/YkuD
MLNLLGSTSLFRHVLIGAGLLLAVPVGAAAAEPAAPASLTSVVAGQASGELRAFYAHRERPLWVTGEGTLRPAAHELLGLLQSAEYDGLDPQRLGAGELEAALQRAERDPSPAVLAGAELALSTALAGYVEAMLRQPATTEMLYEHDVLRPIQRTAPTVLLAAAEAPSLEDYVSGMRWMHPLYAQIREAVAAEPTDPALRQAATASLQRLRGIPAPQWSRHVLIDIASARLWMYEGDQVVDSMRIVDGKADTPTPMMAGYIRQAVLSPYWNVPEHLVRKTIAPGVLSQGVRYLKTRGYEVLSDWSDEPTRLDPATIDWRAVARGEREVVVRQAPGGTNAMGIVKFEFPNPQGIYLHDTPDKNLMLEDARHFSNGCVRLEDAARFGQWLLGEALPPPAGDPEERIDLAQPVPIYITYLTVRADGDRLALASDPYGLDGAAHAALARLH